MITSTVRWVRSGDDRLHVGTADGLRLGWYDLRTGVTQLLDPAPGAAAEVQACVDSYLAATSPLRGRPPVHTLATRPSAPRTRTNPDTKPAPEDLHDRLPGEQRRPARRRSVGILRRRPSVVAVRPRPARPRAAPRPRGGARPAAGGARAAGPGPGVARAARHPHLAPLVAGPPARRPRRRRRAAHGRPPGSGGPGRGQPGARGRSPGVACPPAATAVRDGRRAAAAPTCPSPYAG